MSERIVILGGGESGTGAALLAQAKGYDVFVSDHGPIKENYRKELADNKIPYEENGHSMASILNAGLIVKSPGIPEKSDVVKAIRKEGISIVDEIEFAFSFVKGKVIAITGTNGKTTTTLLTYHILKTAGFKVALAGNVGESFARKVAVEDHDWYVLELSSFQLDGTSTFKPHIAILLNITPDHLDRYEYKMENYIHSKFKLIQNMTSHDHFIYFADDKITGETASGRELIPHVVKVSLHDDSAPVHYNGREMSFAFGKSSFEIAQSDTSLKGPHNLINTMSAVSACVLAGAPVREIAEALKTFINAPHRLESVATINGVEFVNDSKATNVDSVVYALGTYHQPLIWIAGGIDKGNDYNIIKEEVKSKVKVLICLGKDNEKLRKAFSESVNEIYETQSVKELAHLALRVAHKGDVVLLSPACASFDLFRNYEDRGNQFREAVLELKHQTEKALT